MQARLSLPAWHRPGRWQYSQSASIQLRSRNPTCRRRASQATGGWWSAPHPRRHFVKCPPLRSPASRRRAEMRHRGRDILLFLRLKPGLDLAKERSREYIERWRYRYLPLFAYLFLFLTLLGCSALRDSIILLSSLSLTSEEVCLYYNFEISISSSHTALARLQIW